MGIRSFHFLQLISLGTYKHAHGCNFRLTSLQKKLTELELLKCKHIKWSYSIDAKDCFKKNSTQNIYKF